jgi:hypothetical protein
MSAWKRKLAKILPDAEVVGQLADNPGYLINIPGTVGSDYINEIEPKLQEMGCTGWNWRCTRKGITVRAYTGNGSFRGVALAALLALLALLALAEYKYDDIHRFAEAIGFGRHQQG